MSIVSELQALKPLLVVVVLVCVLVFLAMLIDLVSGWHKAKLRGEQRTSYAFSRSISKFIMYEGSLLIAAGIDILIFYSNLLTFLRLTFFDKIPLATLLVGLLLLITELLSVREKADEKTRKRLDSAVEVLQGLFDKDELKELIKKKLQK